MFIFIRMYCFFSVSTSAYTWRFSINVRLSEKFEVRLHWTHSVFGSAVHLRRFCQSYLNSSETFQGEKMQKNYLMNREKQNFLELVFFFLNPKVFRKGITGP